MAMEVFKRIRKMFGNEVLAASHVREQLPRMRVHPSLEGVRKRLLKDARELENVPFLTKAHARRIEKMDDDYASLAFIASCAPHLPEVWKGVDEIRLDRKLFELQTKQEEVGGSLKLKRVVEGGKNVLVLSPSIRPNTYGGTASAKKRIDMKTLMKDDEAALFHTHPVSDRPQASFGDSLFFALPYKPHVVVGKNDATLYLPKVLADLTNLETSTEEESFGGGFVKHARIYRISGQRH